LIAVVAGSAIYSYGFLPVESGAPAPMKLSYAAHRFALLTHVFAALLALLLGPLQFWDRLRQQRRSLHRWMGRIYLGVGVLVGGLSGLYMAQFAYGGLVTQFGFGLLAVAWLYTGFEAYRAIRAGAVQQHRAWMVRNFSLTLAAVSLRVYLPLSMMAGVEFTAAYTVISWLCWVPNLLLAEMVWNRPARALPTPDPVSL
jgi:uncharacterized membrane protein